jgi:hypothetical protein
MVRTLGAVLVKFLTQKIVKYKILSGLDSLSTTPWRRMGEWRYSSTILDLSVRWRWLVSFTPQPLYPRGNSPRYSLDRNLGEPQSRSGLSFPYQESNPGSSVIKPVALSLYRLSCSCSSVAGRALNRLLIDTAAVTTEPVLRSWPRFLRRWPYCLPTSAPLQLQYNL